MEGIGDRLREARRHAAVIHRRTVTQSAMAEMVTEELKRLGSDKTVSQPVWSDYENENYEPEFIVVRAIAGVSGLSEAYIAFGMQIPTAPPSDVVQVHKLTDAQIERAKRAAQAGRLAKQRQGKRRKGPGKAG